MSWILVGLGGALGAVARYGVHSIGAKWLATPFPAAIFVVNIAGSAIIGLLAGALASSRLTLAPEMRLFLTVGILGGFTTFSSFSLDTLTLVRDGHPVMAAINVAGQVGLSLLAVYAGYRLAS